MKLNLREREHFLVYGCLNSDVLIGWWLTANRWTRLRPHKWDSGTEYEVWVPFNTGRQSVGRQSNPKKSNPKSKKVGTGGIICSKQVWKDQVKDGVKNGKNVDTDEEATRAVNAAHSHSETYKLAQGWGNSGVYKYTRFNDVGTLILLNIGVAIDSKNCILVLKR